MQSQTGFLSGLAERLGVGAAVYVAEGSGAPAVPFGPASGPAQAEALEAAARSWLARPADAPAPPRPDLLLVPVTGKDGATLGVVVAAGAAGPWRAEAREAFRFAVVAHVGDLEPRLRDDLAGARPDQDAPDPDFDRDLRAAVERGELRLAFQPEFDLTSGRVRAAEALVRWQHPKYGELGPEWFLSFAERSDLIHLVGAWVVDESIRSIAHWNAAVEGLDVLLRVNLSPTQLVEDDVVARIAAALQRHGVPGHQVCVELTEHAPVLDVMRVAAALRRLKEFGVHCALDDLTMGHSTLSHLRELPVDVVKIDRSLVTGIDTDPRARAIVTAILGLALNLGLDVVAEGVGNAAEIRTLIALGCTHAQGHHLSRPLDPDAMIALLRSQAPAAQMY